MKDQNKTKKQLISELMELRQRITELEALENKSSQAEEALRQSEARYRTLFEDSRDAVYITTLGGKVIDVNKAFLDLLGYTKGELAGITSQDTYVNSYDRQRFQKEIEQKGFVRDFEVKLRKKDNTVIDCLITSSLWLDNGGNILGYQGIIRDITEWKRAEDALQESEAKYRTILQTIEDGYYEVDIAGNFTSFNDSLFRMLGYSRDEMIGMNNRQYMTKETANKVFETFNNVYCTGKATKAFGWELVMKDGQIRYVEISVSPVCDVSGKTIGFRGIARDITERKSLEKARERIINHLSHELRTPLSVIQGYLRLLKRKFQKQTSPMEWEKFYEPMKKQLDRLNEIQIETHKIIRFSQGLEGERILLFSFMERILEKAKQSADHRELHIQLQGERDLSLFMTPEVLEDILGGLLKNAIGNTPDEGSIRIILEQKDGRLLLKVQDFGIGITEENQKQIFDGLFHTVDTGLYTSKKPYDFGAGGKGLDLLRMKVYGQRFGFVFSLESKRCIYIPTDRDLCPGRISACPHCERPEDCLSSGGSTFCVSFPIGERKGV
jgi:PAS domain S-box-containing protein